MISMSKELPVVVQYRIEDMGHIRCATAESFVPFWPTRHCSFIAFGMLYLSDSE